jgi:hypothetical protein
MKTAFEFNQKHALTESIVLLKYILKRYEVESQENGN